MSNNITIKVQVPATSKYCEKNSIACQFDELNNNGQHGQHICLAFFAKDGDFEILNHSKSKDKNRGKLLRCKQCKDAQIIYKRSDT